MISKIWTYYDPTGEPDNYVQNHRDGNVIRTCRKATGYYRNPKYPWLSTSLDYIIKKGQVAATGEILKEECPLETKTIDAFVLGQWESIPTYYLAQVHVEMLIMEVEYSEVVLFDSRKNLHIYPVEYLKEFGDQILDLTHDFSKKTDVAKGLMKQISETTDQSKIDDLNGQIDELEPEAGDNKKAYEEFLKEKYRDSYIKESKEGDMKDWENAINYNQVSAEMKRQEDIKQIHKNKILKSLGKYEYISFGEDGEISYSPSKKGVRTLRVKIKN